MLNRLKRFFRSEPLQPNAPAMGLSSPQDISLVVPMIKAVSSAPHARPDLTLSAEDSPVMLPLAANMMIMYAVDRPTHLDHNAKHL